MTSTLRRRRSSAVASLLLVAVVGAAGCALKRAPIPDTPASLAWYNQHRQTVYQLMRDAEKVTRPLGPVPGYGPDCKRMGDDAKRSRSLPAIPSADLQANLSDAQALLIRSAKECADSLRPTNDTSGLAYYGSTTARLSAMDDALFGQVRLRSIMGTFGDPVAAAPPQSTTTTTPASSSTPTTSVAASN